MPKQIGQNWLLLRGLSRESAHWGEFLPLLRSSFPMAEISTLDLPGTGQRYRETSPCNMTEIAAAVRKQAQEQALLDRPLTIIGLSLGGMVGWEWMQRHPEDICGAVFINTSLASLNPFYHRLRWQAYPNFFKVILQRDQFRRELAIVKCVINRRDRDEKIASEWANIQTKRPIRFSTTLRQLIAAACYYPEDKKLEVPVLLLASRGDRLVSPTCTDTICRKWQIPIRNHPWGGHDLTTDDGDWVAARLQEWVEQVEIA
ncbi:alpha/beta fold hydrolase [Methylomonas sp. MgM2]